MAGGLNDSQLSTETTVDNLTRGIELLHELGARHIVLALLPSKIPVFADTAARLNTAYRQLVPQLRARFAADIRLSRWGEYYDDILDNPDLYGIQNTNSRCAGRALFDEDPTPCASPNTYYYYHEHHPSTAVHKIVADRLYSELIVGPASE